MLFDDDADVRWRAALGLSLSARTVAVREAVPYLVAALDDPDQFVRAFAAAALARIAPSTHELAPAILALRRSRDMMILTVTRSARYRVGQLPVAAGAHRPSTSRPHLPTSAGAPGIGPVHRGTLSSLVIRRAPIRSHAHVVTATDFFTVEVRTARGLITHYVLFHIDHATRAVPIAGITPNPDEHFMSQIGSQSDRLC